jgi:hypothetical protein
VIDTLNNTGGLRPNVPHFRSQACQLLQVKWKTEKTYSEGPGIRSPFQSLKNPGTADFATL